ncbi:MAG: DUF362 domain-containing protein [bacterium]|nr:DUF362 domain-containing protein [bacterium]
MSKVVIRNVDARNLLLGVYQCFEKLGGIGHFVPHGCRIIIKPNFVGPVASEQGGTTDPYLVAALARVALENGARAVYIVESSATCFSTNEVIQKLGLRDALREFKCEQASFVNLDEEKIVKVRTPEGFFLKEIPFPELVTKVDFIWNVPKLKVHYVDVITCAVKNYVGFLPREFRLLVHQTRLSSIVAMIHKLFPESLVITDALTLGSHEGPLNVRPVHFGYLIASTDPVANDVVAGKILGFQPEEIEYAMNAYNLGLGDINPTVEGEGIVLEVLRREPIVKRPVRGIIERYGPFRIVLGGACSGCLTWLKGTLEGWILDGTMERLQKSGVRVSVMLGYNAVDERFDEFIEKMPYVVIGDCTPDKYKNNPDVIRASGCCPGEKIQFALEEALRCQGFNLK